MKKDIRSTMLRRKVRSRLAVTIAATMLLSSIAGIANAVSADRPTQTVQLSAQAEASVRASYDGMGVTKADQDRVIKKFLSGSLPDSATGGPIVSTQTVNKNGFAETVRHFLDGSASRSKVQIASAASTGGPVPEQISQCQAGSISGGYKKVINCKIQTDQAFFSVWFYADHWVPTSGAPASLIQNLRGLGGSSVVGTLSNPSLFLKNQQNSSREAQATGQYNFDAPFVSGYAAVTFHANTTNGWDTSP